MDKKSKKAKVGRVTLRVEPEFHDRLTKVADDLGLTANGVMNYMLARWLGRLELEAAVFRKLGGAGTAAQLADMARWRRKVQGRTPLQYIKMKLKKVMREPSARKSALPDVDAPVTV